MEEPLDAFLLQKPKPKIPWLYITANTILAITNATNWITIPNEYYLIKSLSAAAFATNTFLALKALKPKTE